MKEDKLSLRQILDDEGLLHMFTKSGFDEMDQDGSGYIDRAELADLLNKAARDFDERPPTDDEVRAEFAKLDTNQDERITYDEFVVLMARMLKRWADLMD